MLSRQHRSGCHVPVHTHARPSAGSESQRVVLFSELVGLPVEQPTTFESVVNLKTTEALGLMIPQPVLIRADEVTH